MQSGPQAVDEIEVLLDALEGALKKNAYVAGPEYTLADTAWTAVLWELEQGRREDLWEGGRRRKVARCAVVL